MLPRLHVYSLFNQNLSSKQLTLQCQSRHSVQRTMQERCTGRLLLKSRPRSGTTLLRLNNSLAKATRTSHHHHTSCRTQHCLRCIKTTLKGSSCRISYNQGRLCRIDPLRYVVSHAMIATSPITSAHLHQTSQHARTFNQRSRGARRPRLPRGRCLASRTTQKIRVTHRRRLWDWPTSLRSARCG